MAADSFMVVQREGGAKDQRRGEGLVGVDDAPAMRGVTFWEVQATSIASEVYIVEAESADEARAKIERGEWESWCDLGHEDMDILDVVPLRDGPNVP